MERIIITGPNGYIANNIKRWFLKREDNYDIYMLDLRNARWQETPFEGVSCVIHTSALVHKNENEYSSAEYERVNTTLTKELAYKTKASGVPHFIFISTMAVYGTKPSLFSRSMVDFNTECTPFTKYGISKLNAEKILTGMEDESFKVAVIRPPLVYGKSCPGNYNSLRELTLRFRLCPKIENQKSMLYIDNLCEFIFNIYLLKRNGVFMPQNRLPVKTYELSSLIGRHNNKKIICSRVFNPFVMAFSLFIKAFRKAFGSEYYSPDLSRAEFDYYVCEFEESIARTEE